MSNKELIKGLGCLWQENSEDYLKVVNQERLILDVTENIWSFLEANGLSKSELAQKLGVSRSYVTQILNGNRNMTLRTLADIGYVLKKTIDVSFKDDAYKPPISSQPLVEAGDSFSTGEGAAVKLICLVTNHNGDYLDAQKLHSWVDTVSSISQEK
ncbi:MAG: helix-turn-helix transcriptional regulator [Candidatus Competibacteraceae bacterium]|nr:helix-turn-helix transcriptional regulator [Candidatus Competibacteraceae bacterium]